MFPLLFVTNLITRHSNLFLWINGLFRYENLNRGNVLDCNKETWLLKWNAIRKRFHFKAEIFCDYFRFWTDSCKMLERENMILLAKMAKKRAEIEASVLDGKLKSCHWDASWVQSHMLGAKLILHARVTIVFMKPPLQWHLNGRI